jgi:branched-chain amino acid aminotransferase
MHGGAERLAMPPIEIERTHALILELLRKDASWAPSGPGTSLYLRPLLVATEPFLGVRPSQEYAFFVLISPVGSYYEGGAKPLRIWVEREHVRAAPGGLGAIKTSANYVASLAAAARAKTHGYDQVLWLDAIERRWIEEVGTMNIFVRFEDEIVTPPLGGTILPGITRDSVLTLLRDWGLRVRERAVSIEEVSEAADAGKLREVFGTGTAAVIAPVGELGVGDRTIQVPHTGGVAGKLHEALTEIQRGERADVHGWITRV